MESWPLDPREVALEAFRESPVAPSQLAQGGHSLWARLVRPSQAGCPAPEETWAALLWSVEPELPDVGAVAIRVACPGRGPLQRRGGLLGTAGQVALLGTAGQELGLQGIVSSSARRPGRVAAHHAFSLYQDRDFNFSLKYPSSEKMGLRVYLRIWEMAWEAVVWYFPHHHYQI